MVVGWICYFGFFIYNCWVEAQALLFSIEELVEITLTIPYIQETEESEITEYLNKTENNFVQTTFSIDATNIDDTNIDAINIDTTNQKIQHQSHQNQIKVEGNKLEINLRYLV